jgi:hypothetical protein
MILVLKHKNSGKMPLFYFIHCKNHSALGALAADTCSAVPVAGGGPCCTCGFNGP